MTWAAAANGRRVQLVPAVLAVAAGTWVAGQVLPFGHERVLLVVIGLGLGIALYHAAFGFSAAYRRLLVHGDMSGVAAQLLMIGMAVLLFAPLLAAGTVLGRPIGGAVAPVSLSMAFGAALFGVGMQLGGGCASGTLYTAGGGNLRMIVVLVAFCLGGFWGSLDLHWWSRLPGISAVSLADEFGWPIAVAGQLAVLVLLYVALRLLGGRMESPLWRTGADTPRLLRGPWPLLWTALALALFNAMTLVVAGHPWSITWAFALWPAKLAAAAGWDPGSNPFWSGGFQQAALDRPIWADTVSVMNIGILIGAFLAAAMAGRLSPSWRIPPASLAAAVIGGLMMGYGARLAYGCNIGAFFSGIASASLHGWVWIACAALGTVIGVRLRPLFRLPV